MMAAKIQLFVLMGLLILTSSCTPGGTTSAEGFGVGEVDVVIPEIHRLKIFKVGQSSTMPSAILTIADTINLRAVLIDSTGSLVVEVPVNWYVSGTLTASDLTSVGGDPSKYADFTVSTVGIGNIHAALGDASIIEQYHVDNVTAVTGTITNQLALVPDQIVIVSGNNQTSQAGSFLPQNLKVKVVNAANTPVPGVSVSFSVLGGGGTIISAQPASTDASGEAVTTVQLGGQVGAGLQTYSATISSGSVTQVTFTETATPAAAAKVAFYTQPGGANLNTAFSTQPKVEVQDTYGNRVTTATNTITLARSAGTGALAGSVSIAAVAGLATFSGVSYDTAEIGVTIAATSAGLTAATSNSFDVGSILLAAQCAADGGSWVTADGGCKDITTGLIFSAISPGTMNWFNAVWDSNVSGSDVPEAWEVAKGITKDVDYTYFTYADNTASSYCHSLTESGLTDWRVPTYQEMAQAIIDGSSTALKNPTQIFWSANPYTTNAIYIYNANAYQGGATATAAWYARCVRRSSPTKLIITQQPAAATRGFGVHVPFQTPLIVKVVDSTNSVDITSTASITLSHNGTGQFCFTNRTTGVTSGCGATISQSAVAGVANFSTVTYSKAEAIQITAVSAGLTSVTSNSITMNQTYPYANCLSVGGGWINAVGGCKDTATGAIYSSSSVGMNFHNAIWDQSTAGNGGSADNDDNGKTNDYYANFGGPVPDISSIDYCHDLQESGQTDWRVPDYQLYVSAIAKLINNFQNYTAGYQLTNYSSYNAPNDVNTYSAHSNYNFYAIDKNYASFYVKCIRQDAPAQLVITQQPAGGAYGFGAGVAFSTQPIVKIQDADGATLYGLNTPVTLSILGGTGQFCTDGGSTCSATATVNAVNGVATFTGLMYTVPNETIQLRASVPTITWRSTNINLPSVDSNNLVIPAYYSLSECNVQANWITADGGCQNTINGLTWSHAVAPGPVWYNAVWDSNVVGGEAVDGNDGALTHEYDPAYPPTSVPIGGAQGASNYCHKLKLNGYDDWRMPTYSEINIGLMQANHKGWTALNNTGQLTYVWSSATNPANDAQAYMFNILTNGTPYGWYDKNYTSASIRCVR